MDPSESSDLGVDLRAYVSGRRDSKREQALLRRFRALPQSQRMEVLAPLLEANLGTALVFVDRGQLSRAAYLAVFQQGLIFSTQFRQEFNTSTQQELLQFCGLRLRSNQHWNIGGGVFPELEQMPIP